MITTLIILIIILTCIGVCGSVTGMVLVLWNGESIKYLLTITFTSIVIAFILIAILFNLGEVN